MLKAQATVGPTQIPKIPYSTKNTIQHVSGIAIIQYAKKVTIADYSICTPTTECIEHIVANIQYCTSYTMYTLHAFSSEGYKYSKAHSKSLEKAGWIIYVCLEVEMARKYVFLKPLFAKI